MLRSLISKLKVPIRRLNYLPIDDDLFGLTEDQKELRSTFRNFFETELGPHAKAIDENDDFPGFRDYIKKCGDMGILGFDGKLFLKLAPSKMVLKFSQASETHDLLPVTGYWNTLGCLC